MRRVNSVDNISIATNDDNFRDKIIIKNRPRDVVDNHTVSLPLHTGHRRVKGILKICTTDESLHSTYGGDSVSETGSLITKKKKR